MKFTDIVEELQKTEKRIILARCGEFNVKNLESKLFYTENNNL